MTDSVTSLLQLTFFVSLGLSLICLYGLWTFRHRDPRGYFQLAVLIVSFEVIIFEQWVIAVYPQTTLIQII